MLKELDKDRVRVPILEARGWTGFYVKPSDKETNGFSKTSLVSPICDYFWEAPYRWRHLGFAQITNFLEREKERGQFKPLMDLGVQGMQAPGRL